MLNLILKDLLLNKRLLLIFGSFYVVLLGWWGARFSGVKEYSIFMSFISCILALTIFSREDKFKATALSLSLPVTRKTIIVSRYVLSYALGLVIFGLSAGLAGLWPGSKLSAATMFSPGILFLALGAMTVFLSVLLPLLVWFGLAGLLVFLIVMQFLGVVALYFFRIVGAIKQFVLWFKGGLMALNGQLGAPAYFLSLLAIMTLVTGLSCALSVFLFKRKDY